MGGHGHGHTPVRRKRTKKVGDLEANEEQKSFTYVLKQLLPYLWPQESLLLRIRVVLALTFLLISKLFTVYKPWAYKAAVDAISVSPIYFPVSWILVYSFLLLLSG